MSNLTAAFMGMGMAENLLDLQNALTHWDSGHLELTSCMMPYVEFCDALVGACWAANLSVPGVFEYEVVETFGKWYVHATLATPGPHIEPDPLACCTKLREMVFDFFAQNDANNFEQIRRVLSAVPNPEVAPFIESHPPWTVKTFAD